MAIITEAFKKTYADTLQLAIQQTESLLTPHVRTRTNLRGEGLQPAVFLEPFDFQAKSARFAPTPAFEPQFGTRWVAPQTYHVAPRIDRTDRLSLGFDPQSELMQAIRTAARRLKDKVIIDGLSGSNQIGKDGASTVTLPSTQIVAAGGTGITLEKLLEAQEILMNNGLDAGERKVFVIGPAQHAQLLQLSELTDVQNKLSAEIREGQIVRVLGMPVVVSTLLPFDAPSSTRSCYIWAREYAFLGIWEDVFTDVQYDIASSWAIVLYGEVTLGATRLDEKAVVQIDCVE